MAQTGQRVDPARNFNFLVEIEGIVQANFSECSGLGSTTEVVEYSEGGHISVHKLPGRTTFSDITLKWGTADSTELWAWRQQIVSGTVVRRNGSILIFDLANSTELVRWNFVSAWPTRWEGAALVAKGGDVAIETLVLAHEGLSRA